MFKNSKPKKSKKNSDQEDQDNNELSTDDDDENYYLQLASAENTRKSIIEGAVKKDYNDKK